MVPSVTDVAGPWGGFAEGGGEEELAGCYGGEEVRAAPAGQGQGAGHEGGEGLHGRGALTDLGEEHRDLEDAEAVGRGHVEQAGPGEILPGIRGGQHLGGQVSHCLLTLPQGEVHHRHWPLLTVRRTRVWKN